MEADDLLWCLLKRPDKRQKKELKFRQIAITNFSKIVIGIEVTTQKYDNISYMKNYLGLVNCYIEKRKKIEAINITFK